MDLRHVAVVVLSGILLATTARKLMWLTTKSSSSSLFSPHFRRGNPLAIEVHSNVSPLPTPSDADWVA